VGSLVQSFAESFDKEWGVTVVFKSCRQVVKLYDIVVDFVTFLFESIELACGIFFDCCVNETIDKRLFKVVPESFVITRCSTSNFILKCPQLVILPFVDFVAFEKSQA